MAPDMKRKTRRADDNRRAMTAESILSKFARCGRHLAMQSKSDLIPSRTRDRYWIEVQKPNAQWSNTSGKWLLFVSASRIDSAWRIIRTDTLLGKLGVGAKVATAMPNPLATSQHAKLICVYTYDAGDLDDVRRVRQRLRELGFRKKLPYKTDAATEAGVYARSDGTHVSLLYE